jgi:acetyl-CoA C-acetyltransferase
MSEDRTPILIGAGQLTQRDVDPTRAKEPLVMMSECARQAAADAGLTFEHLSRLDCVAVANIFGWHYGNVPRALAERLGAHPATELYTTLGGNTPQMLVNETAASIAAGRARFALLAGAEALYTVARARRAGIQLAWSSGAAGSPSVIGDSRQGTTEHEVAYGVMLPTTIYPLFENALRAHYGLSLEEHRQRLGELCSRFSAVAAENPYAWFRQKRTAAEITTVTPQNRMIGFPYPKYMNAILDVDQGAAVLMTSVGEARALGIEPSRWVYLWGCGDAHDLWFVSERVNYYTSPAIRRIGRRALAMAGIGIDAIDCFDLYSCFPSAVQISRDMLGIPADDPRPLTVTGGLSYHGGPGNNYTMHAIATMMGRLRAKPGSKGLITGLGWYATKHSVGIYSTEPKPTPFSRADPARDQTEIDGEPHPALALEPRGRGAIETYTVLHDREGNPVRGVVIGRLEDGRRFLANTPEDRSVLGSLMTSESVGRKGSVSSKDGVNRFEVA